MKFGSHGVALPLELLGSVLQRRGNLLLDTAALFLEDPDAGERAALRVELTAGIVAGQAAVVERIAPRGETRV